MKLSRRKLAEYAAAQLERGVSARTIARTLAGYLIEQRRGREIELVLRDVETALARRGHVVAKVSSARELSLEARKALTAYVKNSSSATTVVLQETIDEDIIGGVKLAFAGRQLDATIKTKLEQLTAR